MNYLYTGPMPYRYAILALPIDTRFVLLLTLKWPRYFYSRSCPSWVPRDPTVESHFPSRILKWILHHICMDYKKSQFCKKKWKCCSVLKWRPNNHFFYFVSFRFWPKFEKPFLNGIFQWNLAQSRRIWIHLHYWNNI